MEVFPVGITAFFIYLAVNIAVDGREKKVKAAAGIPVMIRQIYMDYHLPIMPDDITVRQVRFFYDPLMDGLVKLQKQMKEKKNGK